VTRLVREFGEQLELNRPTCFLLHYDRTCSDLPAADKVSDLHLHQVAAPELAVERQVEQRPIRQAAALIEVKSDLPYPLRFKNACFAPTVLPTFRPWRLVTVGSVSGISMIVLQMAGLAI
jgi:hypothetical protein